MWTNKGSNSWMFFKKWSDIHFFAPLFLIVVSVYTYNYKHIIKKVKPIYRKNKIHKNTQNLLTPGCLSWYNGSDWLFKLYTISQNCIHPQKICRPRKRPEKCMEKLCFEINT
jgi:hypothetical protein